MNRPAWREVGRERRGIRTIVHVTQDNGVNAIASFIQQQGANVVHSTSDGGRDLRAGSESAWMLAWVLDRAAESPPPFDPVTGSVAHGVVGYPEELRQLVVEYFGIDPTGLV